MEPLSSGPLSHAAVYSHPKHEVPLPLSDPLVSPDASSIAYSFGDMTRRVVLRVTRLDAASVGTRLDIDLGLLPYSGASRNPAESFAWTSASHFLWTAIGEKYSAASGGIQHLRPVRAGIDGSLELLPPILHASGLLDSLLWAGDEGLAVALFGTREATRAAHGNATPTFAIIDVLKGSILDVIEFGAITFPLAKDVPLSAWYSMSQAVTVILPDGRVRLLFRVANRVAHQLVVWTQGTKPDVLLDPYANDPPRYPYLALSPDGARVLMVRKLSTHGRIHVRGRGTISGEPVEGVLVALHDVGTGRELWTIRATAVHDFAFPAPAISPDGRTALVGLMPTEGSPPIGLISMQDGKIIQTLPAPDRHYSVGFARGGRAVWTHAHGLTALYELRELAL